MDEKQMVSLNALNKAFAKQVQKRMDAPAVSEEKAESYSAQISAAAVVTDGFDFVAAWKKYYPLMVTLLGYIDWMPWVPSAPVRIIKALLAVINSQIIPIFEGKP